MENLLRKTSKTSPVTMRLAKVTLDRLCRNENEVLLLSSVVECAYLAFEPVESSTISYEGAVCGRDGTIRESGAFWYGRGDQDRWGHGIRNTPVKIFAGILTTKIHGHI